MKKYLVGVCAVIFSVVGMVMPTSAADVNNFRISDYLIEMKLNRDSENRSTLTTTETITAQFPEFDQNHGLERAIPRSYDGHPTNVEVVSVTDAAGVARKYDTRNDDSDNLVVRMADMDVFVHGEQTYKLTYVQHDVTKFFNNTKAQEFYWDTNGTDWRVLIEKLTVRTEVDQSLATKLTGENDCYQGAQGSTNACRLTKETNTIFISQAEQLSPGENVTVAIGFHPDTFSEYQMTTGEKLWRIWGIVQMAALGIAGAIMAWVGLRMNKILNRTHEMKPIAPEYLPPKNASVTIAAKIAKSGTVKGSILAAQLIDLAVRHYIKLYEVSEKKWYKTAEYEIEITKDPSSLSAEEQELLSDSFGKMPAVGERLRLSSLKNNMGYFRRTLDNDKKLQELVRKTYELRVVDDTVKKWLRTVAVILTVLAVVMLSPIFAIGAIIAWLLPLAAWRLTDRGLALRRYLEGLKMYIKVAEAERLAMLQSPDGAAKVAAIVKEGGVTEPRQLIELYERVLPYAILFGQEKEWSKQLGGYYEQASSSPSWYSGHAGFNAAAFSSGMHSIVETASYASSSSSNSGGSGGGGASGGGGGGGGGGGC